jgi:dihydrofolate reductase
MTPKISVYIAASLDGFIARKNGEIDFLTAAGEGGEDYGYVEFISSVDLLVMGSHTYEKALSFTSWPYSDKKVIVLSSRGLVLPKELKDKVEVLNRSPRDLVDALTRRSIQHVYLDGGRTIQLFLKEGLVDEMTITIIPVLIGEGLPLFGRLVQDLKFQLIGSKSFKNGFVQNKYRAGIKSSP